VLRFGGQAPFWRILATFWLHEYTFISFALVADLKRDCSAMTFSWGLKFGPPKKNPASILLGWEPVRLSRAVRHWLNPA